MHYHKYYPVDVINGPGTRCTLFVSGCAHHCPGCYNQSTWRVDSGLPFTRELENRIIIDLQDRRIRRRGLSLSGGDPLHPANVETVLRLVRRVRCECPDKDIWLWSGYTREELDPVQRQVIACVDVWVDGRFDKALADPGLKWRGSSNQVIHGLTK